jgi:hypothetical protein
MIYFGQEVGEAGNEDAGFGKRSRTSIFDYIGVPNHQRWMNEGKFDGGKLSDSEKKLRVFYKRLLNFSINSSALMGSFQEIQTANRENNAGYDPLLYSYVRWSENQKLVVIANFSSDKTSEFELKIPSDIISKWNLKEGEYQLTDQLYQIKKFALKVQNGEGKAKISIEPSESLILELK